MLRSFGGVSVGDSGSRSRKSSELCWNFFNSWQDKWRERRPVLRISRTFGDLPEVDAWETEKSS
jgi:hypothetical protein